MTSNSLGAPGPERVPYGYGVPAPAAISVDTVSPATVKVAYLVLN